MEHKNMLAYSDTWNMDNKHVHYITVYPIDMS